MKSPKNYRERLYDFYVTSHLTQIENLTLDDLKKQHVYENYNVYYKRFLPVDRNACIVDIGCGYGRFLYFLQKSGYKDFCGVDISEEQLNVARKLGFSNVTRSDVFDFLQDKIGAFDVIVALDFLEHIPKDKTLPMLDAIYDGMKENGVLILRTPNADGIFGSRFRYWDFTHEVAFTKTSISQVLRCVGFKDVRVYPVKPVALGLKGVIKAAIWNCVLAPLQQLYILIETGTRDKQIFSQDLIAVARKERT